MEKLYKVSKNILGADCGSDHELLIAKFRFKLKKVGKTTRPLRYDLNQVPYDRVPEEIWTKVHDIVQEAVIKTILKKNKYRMSKVV